MNMPASTGRRSRKKRAAPSSEAVRKPFCPARKFQAVNGEASTKARARSSKRARRRADVERYEANRQRRSSRVLLPSQTKVAAIQNQKLAAIQDRNDGEDLSRFVIRSRIDGVASANAIAKAAHGRFVAASLLMSAAVPVPPSWPSDPNDTIS